MLNACATRVHLVYERCSESRRVAWELAGVPNVGWAWTFTPWPAQGARNKLLGCASREAAA